MLHDIKRFLIEIKSNKNNNITNILTLHKPKKNKLPCCVIYSETCLNWTLSKPKTWLNWTLSKSKTCLNWTLTKPKTCLIQTDFIVPSIKCLCYLNLGKPNTCLNWTNYSVPKGFGLDRLYCSILLNIKLQCKTLLWYQNIKYI